MNEETNMLQIEKVEIVPTIKIKEICGKGTKDDPVREKTQYWDICGKKIGEIDHYLETNISSHSIADSS